MAGLDQPAAAKSGGRGTRPTGTTSRTAAACSGGSAKLREEIGHLEAGADRLGALVDPRLRLLGGFRRQHAERDGNAGLERRQLETRGGLPRDEVEMRRLAANHAAEG